MHAPGIAVKAVRKRARQRRDLVLKLLGDFRVLPQSEVNEAALQPLGVVNGAALTAG